MMLGISLALTNQRSGGSAAAPLPLPGSVASLVAIGDSFTAGTGASDAAHRWLNIFAASMSSTLINNAIAGTVLQDSLNKSGVPETNNGRDRYFNAMISPPNNSELAVIPYGYNDARYTAAPTTFNVTAYQAQLDEVVADLLVNGRAPDRILVISPWWISDTGLASGSANPDFNGQTRAGFEAFVTAARAVAMKYGVYYYDAYAYMRDNGGASLIGGDNIHPTDTGHAVIAAGALFATRVPVAVLPVPSFFLTDNFTDTAGTSLVSHTADSGATWSQQNGGATACTLTATDVWSVGGTGIFKASVVPPTADYGVRVYLKKYTSISDNVGAMGRADTAAATFYFFRLLVSTNVYQLFKSVTGTATQLGSDVSNTAMSIGEVRSLELRMVGTTISGWVNNVKVIEVTDSAISAAGRAGIRMGNAQAAGTGIHIDKITALTV